MARMTVKGLTDWSIKLQELGEAAGDVMAKAVYAGAGAVADAVKSAIDTIPEQQGYMPDGTQRVSATRDEKADLKEGLGISTFDNVGGKVSCAVGFEGYSRHKTRKYPKGVPIPMIARSIEKGSSVRAAYPFVRRAAQKVKESAKSSMVDAAQKAIDEITGGR